MTGVAAFATFTEIWGMSHSGRLQSSPTMATISEKITRNGRCLHETSRLANNYLIIS